MTEAHVATPGPTEIILHVGPPKAASTSIQQAARANRAALIRDGVLPIVDARGAVPDLLAVDPLHQSDTVTSGAWARLCREVADARVPYVLISDEKFAWLDDASVHRVVEAFGGDRLRVVIGVRALDRLIPSYWQELLKVGYARSLSEWCTELFAPNVDAHALTHHPTRFWRSEDVGAIAHRWVAAIGRARVHCFVVDEASAGETARRAAEALGIRAEHVDSKSERFNRSLSAEHATLLLALNRITARARLPRRLRRAVAHRALESIRQESATHRHRIMLPEAWMARVKERQASVSAALAATGLTIVGDLERLGEPVASVATATQDETPARVTPGIFLRWVGLVARSLLSALVRRVRRRLRGAETPRRR